MLVEALAGVFFLTGAIKNVIYMNQNRAKEGKKPIGGVVADVCSRGVTAAKAGAAVGQSLSKAAADIKRRVDEVRAAVNMAPTRTYAPPTDYTSVVGALSEEKKQALLEGYLGSHAKSLDPEVADIVLAAKMAKDPSFSAPEEAPLFSPPASQQVRVDNSGVGI